jgi:predicted porin
MKNQILVAITLLSSGSAFAQSSVTLYGLMDAGVTYTNNVVTATGHGANVQFTSGSSQGDRWGMKGSEDLGGGLKAMFVLEGASSFRMVNWDRAVYFSAVRPSWV